MCLHEQRMSRCTAVSVVLAILILSIASTKGHCLTQPETWRFGIGVATQNMVDGKTTTNLPLFDGYKPGDDPWNPLGLGWYFNWSWTHGVVSDPASGQSVEYMPLVGGWRAGVNPSIATIRNRVNANPSLYPDGTTWLIGNEIIWDDQRTPIRYAQDYHEFYHGLKDINPTFKVAIGAIITSVQYNRPGFTGTPLELASAIRDAYQSEYGVPMPVDVWRIHPYVWQMPTIDDQLDYLQSMLSEFRDWMVSVGEQDKPLIITEYGLLHYHPEPHMIEYMRRSFDILLSKGHANGMPSDDGRWVQRWAWFVNNNHVWEAGGTVHWTHCALYNGDTFDIRPLGLAYTAHHKYLNYAPKISTGEISSKILAADNDTQYTVTLKAFDQNEFDDIRDMRVVLYTGDAWTGANGRGYLVWGQTDDDITQIDGTWEIMGDVTGGGRWGYRTDNWGSDTYITPISASTSIKGNERTVTFAFAVKPAWANAFNQKLRGYVRDTLDADSGWIEKSAAYDIVASLDLGEVHNNPDGTIVQIPCGVVTLGNDHISNVFYVQALDRSSGIRVSFGGTGIRTGDVVSVTGEIGTASWGERLIGGAPTVSVLAASRYTAEPMSIVGREVGGGAPNQYTPGVHGGEGLYNIGLLLNLAGRVTFSDSMAKLFYVDDGSGRQADFNRIGIRVQCDGSISIPVPALDKYAMVTGVVSTRPAAGGKVFPILRPRKPGDIVAY